MYWFFASYNRTMQYAHIYPFFFKTTDAKYSGKSRGCRNK